MKLTDYPSPDWTAQNMNRKIGSSTFESCGWCKFRGGGVYKYDCMIEGSCGFLDELYNYMEYTKRKNLSETFWDTKCLLKNLGKEDINTWIKRWKHKINEALAKVDRIESETEALIDLSFILDDKPPMVENRRVDFFNIGERIRLYLSSDNMNPKYLRFTDKWLRATVVNGYRHHDGCVSYVIDSIPESKGKGWGCGMSVPTLIHQWEYEYFKRYPDFWKYWKDKACSRKYNGETIVIKSLEGEEDNPSLR